MRHAGTIGQVLDIAHMPNGNVKVLIKGIARAHLGVLQQVLEILDVRKRFEYVDTLTRELESAAPASQ